MRPPVFDPAPRLRPVMATQAGLFTAAQAYAAGHTHREIQHLRAIGALRSVRRGVYAHEGEYARLTGAAKHLVDARGVLLSLSAPAALSHETAAVRTGLELLSPDLTELHLTRPELPASRLEAGVRHHAAALPDRHVTLHDGARVTSAARTAVDVARTSDFARGLAAVDSALRSGATADEVREVLFFARAWSGSRRASRAVAHADGRSANPGESRSRAVLIDAGLAPTGLQVRVDDTFGLVGVVDFGWLPLRVVGEFDGRGKYGADAHGAADAVWAEKRREDRLRALGLHVVRWTWVDLIEPDRWLARLREALATAQSVRLPGA